MSAARVGAVIRKELAEFRRNRLIVTTAAILPLVFLISPTASILAAKASAASPALDKRVDAAPFLPLLIPVFVPALMSAYSVVGEREQGTLEPVLTMPVRRAEFLAGKAAAIFMPAIGVAYLMFGVFVAIVQQLSILASLPPVALTALMSFQVISPTFGLAAALAGGLLAIDCAACFAVALLFDRERLVTGQPEEGMNPRGVRAGARGGTGGPAGRRAADHGQATQRPWHPGGAMLLSIEPDGPVPIYQQIRDRIVEAIAGGRQPAGSALPSTRQLAVDLGVNFHTVNKGYDLLRQEGLLRLGRKSGAVVRRDAGSGPPDPGWVQDWTGRLRTLVAEAAAQGMPATDIVPGCQAAMADFAFPATVAEAWNGSESPP